MGSIGLGYPTTKKSPKSLGHLPPKYLLIIVLLSLISFYCLAEEPTKVSDEPLTFQDEMFIDKLDKELLQESVKDIPEVKLDGFSDPGEYKFTKEGW